MRYAQLFLVLLLACGGCVSAKRPHLEGTGNARSGVKEPESPPPEEAVREGEAAGAANHGDEAPPSRSEVHSQERQLTSVEVKEYTESIQSVIQSLEECYRTGDFEKWQSLLTPLYKKKYGDPEYLRSQGWAASDLRGFFRLLIAARREGNVTALKISRVAFLTSSKALVFVILEGKEFPEPQHTFLKMGSNWLKGLPEEGE
jgi:hypothetical protein